MSNLIRSSNGVLVDMETLRLQNEKEVAIGNMGVNARGDVINQKREITKSKQSRVKEHYQLHSMIPTRSNKVKDSSADALPAPKRAEVVEDVAKSSAPAPVTATVSKSSPRGSLAAGFTEKGSDE
jgi:hypothetical protein